MKYLIAGQAKFSKETQTSTTVIEQASNNERIPEKNCTINCATPLCYSTKYKNVIEKK